MRSAECVPQQILIHSMDFSSCASVVWVMKGSGYLTASPSEWEVPALPMFCHLLLGQTCFGSGFIACCLSEGTEC